MKMHVGGVSVKLVNGDRYASMIERHGDFEPKSLSAWAKLIEKGKTVIDVGAYTGIYSISAALLGAHVISIEPIPKIVHRLRQNAKANKVELQIYDMAASDKDGVSTIFFKSTVPLSAGASLEKEGPSQLKVRTIRLDSLGAKNVIAMKIDVEKHEPAVLRGARELITKWKPYLIIEVLTLSIEEEVMSILPDYQLIRRMDGRNILLAPKI